MLEMITESRNFFSSTFNEWMQVAMFIFAILGMWKMFGEFGEKKWKSLIPVYRWYFLFKHVWNKKAYGVYISAVLADVVLSVLAEVLDESSPMLIVVCLLLIVSIIVEWIYWIRLTLWLNKAYGYSRTLGICAVIGSFAIQDIVIVLYAYGKKRYLGNQSLESK